MSKKEDNVKMFNLELSSHLHSLFKIVCVHKGVSMNAFAASAVEQSVMKEMNKNKTLFSSYGKN